MPLRSFPTCSGSAFMKKEKCILCNIAIGKRVCRERNNEIICSKCCASVRNQTCEGCSHYNFAEKYHAARFYNAGSNEFIIEINEKVEKEVEDALKLLNEHKIEDAHVALKELLKNHPNYHSVQYGMGAVHAFKNMYDEAIVFFDKAIEIFPYFIEAYYNKAATFLEKNDLVNYIKTLKKFVAIGNENDDLVVKARNLLNDWEEFTIKNEGVDLDTYLDCEIKFKQAFSYMKNQQWEKAISGYKECAAIIKNHPQTWGNLGVCYAFMGEKHLALASLNKALELDPRYELAIVNRAIVEKLEEGEKLSANKHQSIEYYKDYPLKNKSYIQEVLDNKSTHL